MTVQASKHIRIYEPAECVVFLKTNEAFGGLSNMCAGFLLRVNGVKILTSEALYQACRFPHMPEVQRVIIAQSSPMTAKMKSKPHRKNSRADWDKVRVSIMRWCLRVKLAQNWNQFSRLLLRTGDKPIVEQSRKDDFWGAKVQDDGTLMGMNVLGRLLMELRELIKTEPQEALLQVPPLSIPDFLLYGQPIGLIAPVGQEAMPIVEALPLESVQASLFDAMANEAPELSKPSLETDGAEPLMTATIVEENPSISAGFKPYPDYQDSSIEWLGQVPLHWDVRPGLSAFSPKKIKNIGHKESTVLSLSYGRIIVKPPEKLHGLVPESFETYQLIDPGNIIIRPTDLQNDKVSLRIGLAKNKGIITSAYLCLTTNSRMTFEFGYYLLHTYDLMKIFYGLGSGLRQNLDYSDIKRIPIAIPPLDEQDKIVEFLDSASRKISKFIRNKQKLIALLKEQKQNIINQAVTRGTNPNVRLKPSGIEWLGDIPEHWEVAPIKRAFVIMDYGTSESSKDEGEYKVLTMGHIRDGIVSTNKTGYLNEIPKNLLLQKDDLLFNRTNSLELVGKVGIFKGTKEDKVTFASYLVRMRVNETTIPGYMNYLLNSINVLSFARQHAIPSLHQANLNPTRYGRLGIPFPPKEEQVIIFNFITNECSGIENVISRTEQEIQLMQEYRTRLISDAVTGKIDVRDVPLESVDIEADISLDDIELDEDEVLEGEEELAHAAD